MSGGEVGQERYNGDGALECQCRLPAAEASGSSLTRCGAHASCCRETGPIGDVECPMHGEKAREANNTDARRRWRGQRPDTAHAAARRTVQSAATSGRVQHRDGGQLNAPTRGGYAYGEEGHPWAQKGRMSRLSVAKQALAARKRAPSCAYLGNMSLEDEFQLR